MELSPLVLLMKTPRGNAYNLNQAHGPWTVADPGLELKSLQNALQVRIMRTKVNLESARHFIDLWPSPPKRFYLDEGLVENLITQNNRHMQSPNEINNQSGHVRSPLDEDAIAFSKRS